MVLQPRLLQTRQLGIYQGGEEVRYINANNEQKRIKSVLKAKAKNWSQELIKHIRFEHRNKISK